jgi:isochorismate hydrolase
MLADVGGPAAGRALELKPDKSALLVIDMQRYFLDESSHAFIPSAACIVPRLNELSRSYARRRLPVIFTRHVNTAQDAGMLSKWWSDVINRGDASSEIIPDFDLTRVTVLEKTQYDAFFNTDLEKLLLGKGVTQVVIGGVMTHLCCETTARSAFVRGFEVYLAVDGTATYYEQFHRATLLNLAHGFAVPVLTGNIIQKLSADES